MTKYHVRLCQEVWEYYDIEVEAEDEEEAAQKAEDRLLGEGEFEDQEKFPPLKPDKEDVGGSVVNVADITEVVEDAA